MGVLRPDHIFCVRMCTTVSMMYILQPPKSVRVRMKYIWMPKFLCSMFSVQVHQLRMYQKSILATHFIHWTYVIFISSPWHCSSEAFPHTVLFLSLFHICSVNKQVALLLAVQSCHYVLWWVCVKHVHVCIPNCSMNRSTYTSLVQLKANSYFRCPRVRVCFHDINFVTMPVC